MRIPKFFASWFRKELTVEVSPAPLPPPSETEIETYEALKREWGKWEYEHMCCSMPTDRDSPSFAKTVSMGMPIVPLILRDLNNDPHWWMFHVLPEIAHENPCQLRHAGSYPKLIGDWMDWGKRKGYIGDLQ
jgi:hypothetical protein